MTEKRKVSVREVMKLKYDMVDGMMSVRDALLAMKHRENKSLIVDKRDEHDEYGMVLISDIAKKVLAVDKSPKRVNIYEVMTKPILSIDPEAKVIVSSGYANDPVMTSFTDYGFCDSISKPFQMDNLSRKIEKAIG